MINLKIMLLRNSLDPEIKKIFDICIDVYRATGRVEGGIKISDIRKDYPNIKINSHLFHIIFSSYIAEQQLFGYIEGTLDDWMKKSEKELRTAISKEEMIRVANEYFDLDDSAIQYLQSHGYAFPIQKIATETSGNVTGII